MLNGFTLLFLYLLNYISLVYLLLLLSLFSILARERSNTTATKQIRLYCLNHLASLLLTLKPLLLIHVAKLTNKFYISTHAHTYTHPRITMNF